MNLESKLMMLSISEMEKIVYATRNKKYGTNWEEYIRAPALYYADENTLLRPFLQFDLKYHNPQMSDAHKSGRVIGWAHPDNQDLLFKNYDAKLFIDCTFKAVPADFSQLMIVMMYYDKRDYYVPVYYVLMTDKTETSYRIALNQVVQSVQGELRASTVTCDFESALINGIKSNFPNCKMVLCLFHWKQSIRRWILKNTKISDDALVLLLGGKKRESKEDMAKDDYDYRGFLEMLTVLPLEDVKTFGIPYIRMKMMVEEKKMSEEYNRFWIYFEKTWLQKKNMTDWNLADIKNSMNIHGDPINLANRTNNPLERYNRTLNEVVGHGNHPSIPRLVEIFLNESRRVLQEMEDIRLKKKQKLNRAALKLPEIPDDYYLFKNESTNGITEADTIPWYLENVVEVSEYTIPLSMSKNTISSFDFHRF